MNKPSLEPLIGNSYKISQPDIYFELSGRLSQAENEKNPDKAAEILKDIITKCPSHYAAIIMLANIYSDKGDIGAACELRYDALRDIIELVGDSDSILIPYEEESNRDMMDLIYLSGIDHFLINDFEMAAGIFELLLDLDEDDLLEATVTLAYCYVAIDEYEMFEDVAFDLSYKDPLSVVVMAWAAWKYNKSELNQYITTLKRNFPQVYQELLSEEHPVTEEYLKDISNQKPSTKAIARQLWFRTENVWAQFPEFIEYLRNK